MGITEWMGVISGSAGESLIDKLIYKDVIGFRGIVDGVGCSSIVSSVALALSERTTRRVCVVDTNILYPSQYALLCKPFSTDARSALRDWFSFDVTIPERIIDTDIKRVHLLGCFNRRIIDAFSPQDSLALVEETFDRLKELFDIILVDLSHEWSQLSMGSAVKCNEIFTIIDPSSRCITNMTQSLNALATAAVPLRKFKRTIINKYSAKGFTGMSEMITKLKLDPIATIPFSQAIFEANMLNRNSYGLASADDGVIQYNGAIDAIVSELLSEVHLEILDLEEVNLLEEEMRASGIKNRSRARRVVEKRLREPLLTELSGEEKEKVREKRLSQSPESVIEEVAEEVVLQTEVETFEDMDGRLDLSGGDA